MTQGTKGPGSVCEPGLSGLSDTKLETDASVDYGSAVVALSWKGGDVQVGTAKSNEGDSR
jgi:hypothetical protein